MQSFELRTDDGQLLSFRADGEIGFTPGHLREHMVLGQPITVTYRQQRDERLALSVGD